MGVFFAAVPLSDANAFLSPSLPSLNLNAGNLLEELERVLTTVDRVTMEARSDALEERLRTTFKTLPQDKKGHLEPAAVRYLLHRYFVDRHGWYVLGFDTQGEAWNSSTPFEALSEHIDSDTQGAFEDRLDARGLSLHEVALLAVTLESFVHSETLARLHSAYRVLGLENREVAAKETEVVNVLETYMLMYVLGLNHTSLTRWQLKYHLNQIEELYPTWNETRKWIRSVREEVVSSMPEARGSFDATVKSVEAIGDKYGRWQHQECMDLKDSLLKLENNGKGRVPLAKFYEAALNGMWQFSENKGYLRQLGSLDETDPNRPSVIVANYVNSPANCVAASKFYYVCCINECESLTAHLERHIPAAQALPSQIIEVVEKLPSSTVDAPRKLPQALVARLYEIAAIHGGHIPFHARLFNQWLHHAYPTECPYPHMSGTSKPVFPEKFMEETGEDFHVDQATMKWHVEQYKQQEDDSSFDEQMPWSSEEEFFISRPGGVERPGAGFAFIRATVFMLIAGTMFVTLMRMISSASKTVHVVPHEKMFV